MDLLVRMRDAIDVLLGRMDILDTEEDLPSLQWTPPPMVVQERERRWSSNPPRNKLPRNYYVRRLGSREYEMVRISPEDDFWPGLEWFGPLPEPPV